MALDAGHPVYFLIFFTRPGRGQTLADVRNAQIRFIKKVRELHPEAPRTAIIGNCQGGWAAALVGAERPDLVVVFASFGDNITPPQQAFNWIVKTYGTVEEIKRRGQVIVFISHSNIGHLGIFVSAKIARKEHKEIIASFDMLDYLPPGL